MDARRVEVDAERVAHGDDPAFGCSVEVHLAALVVGEHPVAGIILIGRAPEAEPVPPRLGGVEIIAREDRPKARIAVGHERTEETTSELKSLMRIQYAVFC